MLLTQTQNVLIYSMDVEEIEEMVNAVRRRVKHPLTADECKQYLHADGCPK